MKVFIEQSGEPFKKNVFNKQTGKLEKTVLFHLTYPYPYGYILGTKTSDGDELDCYIITDKKLEPESITEVEPIGMVEWFEDGLADHKILMTLKDEHPLVDNTVKQKLNDFADNFFKNQPNKNCNKGRFLGKEEAVDLINKSWIK